MGNVVDVSVGSWSISLRCSRLASAGPGPVWGAEHGFACAGRGIQAAGWSHRYLDIRGGTIHVAMPKLRHGASFPD